MNEIIPNGTQVLVFYQPTGHKYQNSNEGKFIKGTIISSKESEDLSYHGSPWYVQIYTILGEDGEEYEATHNSNLVGAYLFRTPEEQVDRIKYAIQDNHNKIDDINKENERLTVALNSLQLLTESLNTAIVSSETSGYAKTLKK